MINYEIFGDKYFVDNPTKKQVLNDMVEHFSTHKDKHIFKKKINYLCNKKERMCICNTNANNFRKIYDGINYTDEIFSVWIKNTKEPF